MIKRVIKTIMLKKEGNSFKNDKVIFCFLLFSSNKFIEFLLLKLNTLFIKYEFRRYEKKKIV